MGKDLIWLDAWQGKVPLRHQHPVLFELCNEKKSMFRFRHVNGSLDFRRWSQLLLGSNGIKFNIMPSRTLPISDDVIRLRWTRTGVSIVKSAYEQLTKTNYGQSFKNIWKPKIPQKKLHVSVRE